MIDEKLKRYVNEKGIKVKFLEFSEPVLSVKDSADKLGVGPERIAKSLVFVDEKKTPILVIVGGDRRVNEKRLSRLHGSEIRMAKAREVEKYTGYKVGEVPPIGLRLKTFVDRGVINFDTVIAGGGTTRTLIEVSPKDIIKASETRIVDLGDR